MMILPAVKKISSSVPESRPKSSQVTDFSELLNRYETVASASPRPPIPQTKHEADVVEEVNGHDFGGAGDPCRHIDETLFLPKGDEAKKIFRNGLDELKAKLMRRSYIMPS